MMKRYFSSIFTMIIFLTGLSLLLYPTISNIWNQRHATEVMTNYSENVSEMDSTSRQTQIGLAKAYNEDLSKKGQNFNLSDVDKARYRSILNINKDGVIGVLEIPAIQVKLPIYHGTEDKVLQQGIGHLEWSSFPVGGENTHAVLSGHRGLPSAKLLTDLDKVKPGDTFTITVLEQTINYVVDQILVVEPSDTSALMIEKGKDYCTLFACTPYGINTHRLLVRGVHTGSVLEDGYSSEIDFQFYLPLYILLGFLFTMVFLILIKVRQRRKKG